MKLNLLPPALIVYTDDLPDRVGGRANGPYVRIRPKYQTDAGLHKHELAHVEVFWLTLGLSGVLGALFKDFDIWNEARAYRVQTKHPDANGHYMTVAEAAERLADPHYGFGLATAEAQAKIK